MFFKKTWYHFAIFMLLNNHIWRSGAYTLFLMMSFFCCTEWGLHGLKRTKCSAVRSCASPTTEGSFFPDTDTRSSAISWPSPGEHTHIIQETAGVNIQTSSINHHFHRLSSKKVFWSLIRFTLNGNVFHLAVVTHNSENLTALLSGSGKENHLKTHTHISVTHTQSST